MLQLLVPQLDTRRRAPEMIELITEDGIPMETPWHRAQMNLLIELTHVHWRGRTDFYTGGNMFLYFSLEQARNRDYRGPDFFIVTGVDGTREREAWVVWDEAGRYPDLIVELLSDSTAREDMTVKKALYERTFRTPEYFCYDPRTRELLGWHLLEDRYEPLLPDARGWLWSAVLQLWLGEWEGELLGRRAIWLRFFDEEGALVPTEAEAARLEAEATALRAETADAEAARLRAELARLRAGATP